jgi:hypothetical protein
VEHGEGAPVPPEASSTGNAETDAGNKGIQDDDWIQMWQSVMSDFQADMMFRVDIEGKSDEVRPSLS